MKKIVLLLSFALSLPMAMMAQSNNDDLYFVPSKEQEKQEEIKPKVVKEPKVNTSPTVFYTAPGSAMVIEDRKGNKRDVDEYNRRYSSKENNFSMQDDTLYVKEKSVPDLEGEWVDGFDGSQDDYEYAERIIRFRNPRFAVSISSPLYWDIVYGANSWNWNVYTDGFYAYAFPTFTNRLWWDWRFNSYGSGWGWGGGWSNPYYGWGGGGYWGPHWGHHHHYPGWGGGGHWARNTYTNRNYAGSSNYGNSSTTRRYGSNGSVRTGGSSGTSSYNRGDQSTARRVIGTRTVGERNGTSSRTDASSTRRSIYTRPSSTRSNSSTEASRSSGSVSTPEYSEGGRRTSSRSSSTYSKGSSTAPSRSSSTEESSSSSRSYTPSRSSSSSSRSYSSPSGSSSRSYSTGGGGGSSSRSSGGGGASRSRR